MKHLNLAVYKGIALMSLLSLASPAHVPSSREHHLHQRMAVDSPNSFTVVIDAGSSGSRVRVYALGVRPSPTQLPNVDEISNKKLKPGISEFADRLDELPAYLTPLINEAIANVPVSYHCKTPIYLMATAGMRLLSEDKANDVMETIDQFLSDTNNNPFRYESLNTRILSGEEEGAFAWIAANFLQGSFEADFQGKTAGILEGGGASAQLAFVPEGSLLADKFPVKIAQTQYPIYVHSFLEYGQNEVILRAMEQLQSDNPTHSTIDHPCMLSGDSVTVSLNGMDIVFNGIGEPSKCLELINTFVVKDDEFCSPKPCSLRQVYQPSIEDDHKFYVIGTFFYAVRDIGALGPTYSFLLSDVRQKAVTYCQRPFEELRTEEGGDGRYLSARCIMSLYLHRLATYAFGIDEDSTYLHSLGMINGEALEWPLGAAIYQNELLQ